jgi:TonB family protein
MKRIAFLISMICICATFALAQKTVRKRSKSVCFQTTENQKAQTNSNANQVQTPRFDKPLKILDKPRPQLFPDGQDCSQGKVVLRVTFSASGKIGSISVISGLTKEKTESSIEAAKKIKFEPATRNGIPFSVTKPVEYSFTIY